MQGETNRDDRLEKAWQAPKHPGDTVVTLTRNPLLNRLKGSVTTRQLQRDKGPGPGNRSAGRVTERGPRGWKGTWSNGLITKQLLLLKPLLE